MILKKCIFALQRYSILKCLSNIKKRLQMEMIAFRLPDMAEGIQWEVSHCDIPVAMLVDWTPFMHTHEKGVKIPFMVLLLTVIFK